MNTKTIRYLTQDELRRLLGAIPTGSKQGKRDKALLYLAYRMGLRVSEVTSLHVDDIDRGRRRITIRRVKGSYGGEYSLPPDCWKLIVSYLRTRADDLPYLFISNRGNPLDRTVVFRAIKRYAKLAGIPESKVSPHALKHSLGTHMLEAGCDIAEVQDQLGHRNIQNTMVYAKITSKKRDEIARRLDLSNAIV
ncbi:hypothetical protein FJZ36_15905 [Candidatus Poribacteria bacterium]|nr:hypothetical protein [Candidatus Poribacteria bacterium]